MAAVESVKMFACAIAGRFFAWTMCDPDWAGVAENGDVALIGGGRLSLRGPCWKGEIGVVDMGASSEGTRKDWEGAIAKVSVACTVAFTDGSRDEGGRVVGGWCDSRGGEGCEPVRLMAMV